MEPKTARTYYLKNEVIKKLDKFSKDTKRDKTEIVETATTEHIERNQK